MLRYTKKVLVLVMLLSVVFSTGWTHSQTHRKANAIACPSKWWITHSPYSVAKLVVCEAKLFGVSSYTAHRVAACESGFYWKAGKSNGFHYLGVFQHAASAWLARWEAYARLFRSAWYNARTNIVAAMRLQLAYGWGPWSCY